MRTCPSCGEENPDRFRLCGYCGTPLDAAVPGLREERKVVSVLFVDLVGFTARSDRADPEDVRAALQPYHALLKREIERYGGTVEKFIGDAVMAVFGAPVAHEDDAERAVRAALRIAEAIQELNASRPGLDLAIRAAVNTGEAVVTLGARPEAGEGFVTGDVVNTASRLQGEAPTGGVVVGEGTWRAARDQIVFEELPPVTVKGKAEPVPLYRAVEARSRFGVDVEAPAATRFVGREHDLSLLADSYARTVRDRAAQLVTVTGEPGVGKTRLISEFRDHVDALPELVYWRQGRCLPYGEGIAFWPLGEVVKAHAGILESDGPEEAERKLREATDPLPVSADEREWMRSRLAPLIGLAREEAPGGGERAEAFTAWRHFLEAVADTRTLILVFEDMHWADEAFIGFVEDLIDWATEVPMLVVCTGRPELYERHPGWGGGKRNSATIALGPLSAEETGRLLADLLQEAALPAETQAALLERAGGNPLYAEEFVRMLTDRGILVRRGRSVELVQDAEIAVPDSVQALIAARLDTLGPDRKGMLQDASVMGKVFWSGAVAAIGGVDEEEVRQGLHELARKELVRPARSSSVHGQAEYSFWHALVRDVTYGQLPRSARSAKHRAAARWIEELAGDRVADHAELLAYHYGEALEMERATGDPAQVRELEDLTRGFLVIAGSRYRTIDPQTGSALLRRAVDLTPEGHPDEARVLTTYVEALYWTSRGRVGLEMAARSVEAARRSEDPIRLGFALVLQSAWVWIEGDTARAREMVMEGIASMEQAPPGAELAFAYTTLAGRDMIAGNAEDAVAWALKGIELAERVGAEEHATRALGFLGAARCDLGQVEQGLDDLRRALDQAVALNLPSAGAFFVNLGDWVWGTEGPLAGLEIHRAGIAHCVRRGLEGASMWARAETTWMLYDAGRWDEVLQEGRAVLAWDLSGGGLQQSGLALPLTIRVLLERGEMAEVPAMLERDLEIARRARDPQLLVPALTTAIREADIRGDGAAVAALVDEAEQASAHLRNWRFVFLPVAARALAAAGMADRLRELVDDMPEPTVLHDSHKLAVGRAVAAEATGDAAAALDAWREAGEASQTFGHVPEAALAALGMGRALLALGRAGESADQIGRARATFADLGAVRWLAEADELLGEATARTS